MDKQNTQPQSKPEEKNEKRRLIAVLPWFLVLALAGTGFFVFTKWDSSKKEVTKLQNQIKDHDNAPHDDTTEETHDDSETSEDTEFVTYKAEVGKFTLKLPKEYVVVEDIDGAGEGGSATIIKVGKKQADGSIDTGTVSVDIYARPNYTDAKTIDGWITDNKGTQVTLDDLKDGTFAEQKSRYVSYDELGSTEVHYILRNDIGYEFSFSTMSSDYADMMQLVEDGLSFN